MIFLSVLFADRQLFGTSIAKRYSQLLGLGGRKRNFSSSRIMATDAGYATFIHRLLRERGVPAYIKTVVADGKVHPMVRALGERRYISDEDVPFEGVSFDWGKTSLPSEDEFGDLIGARGEKIKKFEPSKWDTRGDYEDVVDAVTTTINGGPVKVYRVEESGSRVRYFVIGVDRNDEKVVGVKALAIEPSY